MSGFDWTKVRAGDAFTVKRDSFTRAGMTGFVLAQNSFDKTPEADSEGVNLDFFCDVYGDPRGLPSIERWNWSELELPDDEEPQP